ncbi:hypothetical protein [Streptomyces sp. NPDC089795]|uniref:hypothetical protein n=1 Tax=Streptomyces sp. NPDC089795 TaxID=3155297 RepID=UPI0034373467
MHNPVAERDDLAFDFGATALGRSFHYDWTNYAVSPLDHIAQRYGEKGDPTPILLLVEDLLRLRDSDLSGGEINLLWCATDIALGAPVTAGKERDWLQEVVSFVVPLAKSRGASTAACSTYPECVPDGTSPAAVEHRRLTAEVVELVGLLNQRSGHEVPLASMQEALRRCAESVCTELAFRFLLCAANHFYAQLSPATYGRLERLGTAIGYGPHVVDGVRYLAN